MMGTAFMGYVLPWGQMSFWGASVITSLVTAVPLVGQSIVDWLWGGFTVNNATLNRFFSLHFLFPFLIAGMSLLHLALLHRDGSNNPLGIDSSGDQVSFYPYFFVKDLFAFFCFFSCRLSFFQCPRTFLFTDNAFLKLTVQGRKRPKYLTQVTSCRPGRDTSMDCKEN